MLERLKHYVYPANPMDSRTLSRLKRGIIHYAHTGGWSAIPPMQRWIRRHSFEFRYGQNGSSTRLQVSGADLTHLWVADEVLAENVYKLEAVPFTPELVIDLGANIGLFTLLAGRRWPQAQIVSVEPHPFTFQHLCANVSLNGIHAATLQCAVGAEPAVKYLCNEGAVFQAVTDTPGATAVMTIPIDALLPHADELKLLIKMDIEGAEVSVLEAMQARLPSQTFIFIELHAGDASLAWMKQWAGSHGFEFTEIRRREEAIDGYLTRSGSKAMG